MQPNAEITTIAFVVKIMAPQTLVSILHYRTIPPVIKQTREKKILPKYAVFLKKTFSIVMYSANLTMTKKSERVQAKMKI